MRSSARPCAPAGSSSSSLTSATVPTTFSGSAADNLNGAGLAANSTTFTILLPASAVEPTFEPIRKRA